MKIRKMTASFGTLSHRTLTLHEGLNILSAPNEAGKSTWAEFLLAMLYGVDTSERQKQGGPIPVKERCRPWNGALMEGQIELDEITVERTGTARAPMSVFRAYRTDSGIDVPLTGADCGQKLLGVERSVYERSAFIRQCALPVTKDAPLEQRLGALVTSGDDGVSYTEAEQRLRDLHNRCGRPKTGLIDKTQTELAKVAQQLEAVGAVQEQMTELEAKNSTLLQKQRQLQQTAAILQAQDIDRKREQLRQAQAQLSDTQSERRRLEEGCKNLPSRQMLEQLSRELDAQQGALQTAAMDAALSVYEVKKPDAPAAFAGLDGTQATAQAQQACEQVQAAQQTPQKASPLLLIFGCVLAALGLAAGIYLLLQASAVYACIGLGVFAVGAALLLVWLTRRAGARKQAAAQAETGKKLLEKYGVHTPQEIQALAAQYSAALAQYEQALATANAERTQKSDALAALKQQEAALLTQITAFAPSCTDAGSCRSALHTALRAQDALESAQRAQQQAAAKLEALQQAIGELHEAPQLENTPSVDCDEATLQQRMAQCNTELLSVRSQLDRCRGQLAGFADPMTLAAQEEQLSDRLTELQQKNEAFSLASEALDAANLEVSSRFSPMLCKKAGELFSRLTGGAYEKLLVSSDFSVTVQKAGDTLMRPAPAMSCGTVDQLYLAIRLAISELLLPPDAPLVLDDALMAFDDERAALALALLRELGENRQILLFTCHSRELSL